MVVANPMEFPRACKESFVKDVRSYADYNYLEVIKAAENPWIGGMKLVAAIADKELGKGKVMCVPHDFASMATDVLREEGLTVRPLFNVVEKARETKEPEEIEEIGRVQKVTEKVVAEAINLISDCNIGTNNSLVYGKNGKKKPLTVGDVKSLMGHRLLDEWCSIEDEIIVACGPPSADPHFAGNLEDKIRANQPIILDVYPRSIKKRYWADMTRTVVRGKAAGTVRRMFNVVLEAKNTVVDALHAGALGSDMHNLCCDILEKAGYETARGGKRVEKGFTHSLGHGVGLDIHEGPTMSELYRFPLEEHNIVTVEPGLYDPRVGGVRIEDMVEVTKNSCRNLSQMPVQLEI
jgi:Xaa-Pro aminopeptidase